MAILPHDQPEPALELALSLDIPFWPQLPHLSFYEDMYVQAGEHFPGILLFPETNRHPLRYREILRRDCPSYWSTGMTWTILTSRRNIPRSTTAFWNWI